MVTDSIADCLTRIRNAQQAGHASVPVACTNAIRDVLEVLAKEGFVESYEVRKGEAAKDTIYNVVLKYHAPGEPVISELRRISKPGRRVYCGFSDLPKVRAGLGICVVSTSQGVMSDREARRKRVGGELLAQVA